MPQLLCRIFPNLKLSHRKKSDLDSSHFDYAQNVCIKLNFIGMFIQDTLRMVIYPSYTLVHFDGTVKYHIHFDL
jgi:hypothetical protein